MHSPSQRVNTITASAKRLTQLPILVASALDFKHETTKPWATARGADGLRAKPVTPDIVVARDW